MKYAYIDPETSRVRYIIRSSRKLEKPNVVTAPETVQLDDLFMEKEKKFRRELDLKSFGLIEF